MSLAYRSTTGADPHLVRRAAILRRHPEIRQLAGWDARPVERVLGVLLLQVAIAAVLSASAPELPWWATAALVIVLAWAPGALLAHYGGVVIHEASHDLCAPGATLNRLVGILANLVQLLPYAMTFRRHHLTHHVHLGVIGIDNDLPDPLEQRIIANGPWRKLAWLIAYPFVGGLLRGYLGRPNRWELVNVGVIALFDLGAYALLGPVGFAYLALSAFLSASLHPIAAHFIHEHYLWDERQETYSYYGPLNLVTENMGYHVEHHDFLDVPGSRLPELHRIAREAYEPLVSHRSWSAILFRFVTDRRLSHYSRYVRERAHVRGRIARTMPGGPRGEA